MAVAAILSDIHANLEALEAVLGHIDARGLETILCLGDIVGYGPDPIACTDLVRARSKITIRGNHDEAIFKGPWGFNQLARRAIEWTRKELRPVWYRPASRARWRFLETLPLQAEWEGNLLVHGSPRDPTSEYIMPHHALWAPERMFDEIFGAFATLCFVGHTHIAGVFLPPGGALRIREEGGERVEHASPDLPRFIPQAEIGGPFSPEPGTKLLVNVGSVGQPRDRDPRACYLTFEDGILSYHRVGYPWEKTAEKIRRIPELDDRLGERLGRGE